MISREIETVIIRSGRESAKEGLLSNRNRQGIGGGASEVVDADRLIAALLDFVAVAGFTALKDPDFAAARADRRGQLLAGLGSGYVADPTA